ncbi:hypothetical protein BH23GEM8_BH23GEM8_21150 [soil metagenome]
MNRRCRALVLTTVPLLIFALPAARADAQRWVVDAGAGHTSHEAVGSGAESLGATLGVRREGSRWLYLSAGLPLDSESVPWGAVGAGGRVAAGSSLGYGVDAGAHAYGFKDRSVASSGAGLTADILPLAFLRLGSSRLEIRSGVVHHASVFSRQSDPSLEGGADARTVHHSDARAFLYLGAARLVGESRFVRAEEGDYPYAGASVEVVVGRGRLWGSAGTWFSELIEQPVWAAGARVGLPRSIELYAQYQQDTNDPLYWNTPRRSWSVGISRALRPRSQATAGLQSPVIVGSRVTFRIPLSSSADPPMLGGDFNGWQPVPMQRDGGFWIVILPISPGFHRYAYRRADGEWFVPDSVAGRIDDGFGGVSATILVQ